MQRDLCRIACMIGLLWMAGAIATSAQVFTPFSLNGTDGSTPDVAPVQATNGNFYGVTLRGGATSNPYYCCGTVYEATSGGKLTTLYSFCPKMTNCTDGASPTGLVQGADGKLYGTTATGGTSKGANCFSSCGTIFRIAPNGKFKSIYSFCSQPNCTDGYEPSAGLVQGLDGSFYGTTTGGGANNQGTIFKITPAGMLTTLYSFCPQSGCMDGYHPNSLLVLATDGNLYGTTPIGGANGSGTIFKITPTGDFTALFSLDEFNAEPNALIQAADGSFYGTTHSSGSQGSAFQFIPPNTFNLLYIFYDAGPSGSNPAAPLVQGIDGNFWGTASMGGLSGGGTMFKMTAAGKLTTIHTFCVQTTCADGNSPGALMQATNGIFYGTAALAGQLGYGTLYSLDAHLAPFAESIPNFGSVGQAVRILGNNLKGTTSVTFNGTPATFTVVSKSYIQTNVPAGATSGTIEVVTPNGTLSSNMPFQVVP